MEGVHIGKDVVETIIIIKKKNETNERDLIDLQRHMNKNKNKKTVTGNISVMSSPSGFKKSRIFSAHADLKSGSMAQKNLFH